jgi:hypothetical protein
MGFGIGEPGPVGYGDADSWGGPADGIDIQQGIGNVKQKVSARIASDHYLFMVIGVSLVALWLLGGVAFKSARM